MQFYNNQLRQKSLSNYFGSGGEWIANASKLDIYMFFYSWSGKCISLEHDFWFVDITMCF